MTTRTASEDTVSDANIAAYAHLLLENSKILLNDNRRMPVSKDAIESIYHDVHLAFALLARRYNSEVPVNRLHPELLGMVFELLREPTKVVDPEEPLDQSVFALYTPLINAMTVCHKWYVIATEKTSLWTDVDYVEGRAGHTCLLHRSGTAPIRLRTTLQTTRDGMPAFPKIVRANASRLRELDVCMKGVGTMRTVELLLRNDMPLLQTLRLSAEDDQRDTSTSSLGTFPSLRGMMLMGFFFLPAPDVRPFTKLTHLQVSMLSKISIASITAFLDATPMLQVLELHECTAVTLSKLPTHITTLVHLTHLTIRRMSTRIAEELMPALALPRHMIVHLWYDVDAAPTDALLPHPQYWRNATRRVRAAEGPYGSLTVHLEDPMRPYRVALCLEYDGEDGGERPPLWPLPVPTLAHLPSVTTVHLSVFRRWRIALAQCAVRFPALTTLIIEAPVRDPLAVAEMVMALCEGLQGAELILKVKEVALVVSCTVPGLTSWLTPVLRKRKRDGVPVERLGTWVVPVHKPSAHHAPQTTMERDVGDLLAQYVEAGHIEHEEDIFWPRDEELWRQENEFWEVPRMWW